MEKIFSFFIFSTFLIFFGCSDILEENNLEDPLILGQISELHKAAKANIGDTEKAYEYASKMLNLAREINSQKDIGNAYNILGALSRTEDNYVDALKYYLKSSKAFEESKDSVGMAKVYNNIGNIYRDISKHSNAIHFYKRSLRLKTWLKDKEGMAITNRNIAFVYQLMEDYEKARDSYWTSLYIWKNIGNEIRMAQLYNDLGIVYELILEKEGSENYDVEKNIIYNLHLNALELNKKRKNQKGIGWVLNNIATSYIERGDFDKALEKLKQSLELKLRLKDDEGLATTYNNFGLIYLNHYKDLDTALTYFKKAEKYADHQELKKTYELLAEALESKGDFASAIVYIKKLDGVKEKLRKTQYKEELAQIEAKYSVEYAGL